MDKSTKYCELTLTLTNGARVTGHFHVEARTSSSVRPSGAIREIKDGALLLTDATIHQPPEPHEASAILIPFTSIAWIELPPARWISNPSV